MFESTRRRILASRSPRSLYRRAFSSEIAACDASSFQYRDPGGREHVRCQLVLEIEHPDQLGLLHQGQAEDRPGVLLTDVLIRRERILRQGVIKDHAFPRPDHVMEHGFGKLGR